MSLFDDDFYSTKVSRRARSDEEREWGRSGWSSGSGWRKGGGNGERPMRPLQLAFASSMVSALAAVMLFGLIFGFGGRTDHSGGAAGIAPVPVTDTSERIIQAASSVGPTVVSIINEQLLPKGGSFFAPGRKDLEPEEEMTLQQASLGSGVIYQKGKGKASIITNYHVVEGADKVKAVLVGGEVREAKIIGKDQITDLAVLEIDDKGIDHVAAIGDSRKLRDGETVIAIGNPLGLGNSLTMGIVSKNERVIPVSLNQDGVYDWEQEVIQIDASINQGNSGGALVNLNGELIGINSMKVADYGVEGLGFAIPMHNAMPVVELLQKHGYVPRPYLGVYTLDLEQYLAQEQMTGYFGPGGKDEDDEAEADEDDLRLPEDVKRGIVVLEAVGPAKEAGLKFQDVIVKLDDLAVGTTMELRKYLYEHKTIGDKVKVSFYRDGKLESTTFKLAENIEDEIDE